MLVRHFFVGTSLTLGLTAVVRAQEPVIVDNADPGFAVVLGSWQASANPGFYGTDSLVLERSGIFDSVRWDAPLPETGYWQVSAWWVAAPNRVDRAPYRVTHAAGTTEVVVDQRTRGSEWVALGAFRFDPLETARVTLSEDPFSTGFLSADAVRFDYLGADPPGCGGPTTTFPSQTPTGCGICSGPALPGSLQPHPDTVYTIHSDLPEVFTTPGVLYTTNPVIPPADNDPIPLNLRTQTNNGFTTIDDDFDIFIFHITQPGDGSQPRRVVVYTRNTGANPVTITPRQVIVTDGIIANVHEMESTLGSRVLANDWDTPVDTVTLQPGEGTVIAYGKAFAGFPNGPDLSANVNCFGRVQADVEGDDPSLEVAIVGIPRADISQNTALAEGLLDVAGGNGETFLDLSRPPQGCELSRATGVFPSFEWRNDPALIDVNAVPARGIDLPMALSAVQAQGCPVSRQTADMLLHPGFGPGDTVGNYMIDYRLEFELANSNPAEPRALDIRFGKSNADIGLAYQVVVSQSPLDPHAFDNAPVRTDWAGPNQSTLDDSLLAGFDGALTLAPCSTAHVGIRFLVLGNSSLPFTLSFEPATPGAPLFEESSLWFVQ